MKRRAIFFTADWHIGHQSILHLSKRPFTDLEHMQRTLIRNYNACVPAGGICYFLGDMGLCNSKALIKVTSQLNGTKVLVLGNHDKGVEALHKLGFDVVCYGITLQIAKQKVTMSHCPLLGLYREDTRKMNGSTGKENWYRELNPKNAKFTRKDEDQFHLHGHIHSPNSGRSKKIEGRQYDIGIDANKYIPVPQSRIESWVARSNYENRIN